MSEPRVTIDQRYGHPRAVLTCPAGHEVVSSPVTSATGARLAVGDLSGESCGTVGCDWDADA